jgi:hypothetical protein
MFLKLQFDQINELYNQSHISTLILIDNNNRPNFFLANQLFWLLLEGLFF